MPLALPVAESELLFVASVLLELTLNERADVACEALSNLSIEIALG